MVLAILSLLLPVAVTLSTVHKVLEENQVNRPNRSKVRHYLCLYAVSLLHIPVAVETAGTSFIGPRKSNFAFLFF